MFSPSEIFIYLSLLSFGGYFFYHLVILHKSLQDSVDLEIPLIIMSIFIALSGLAKIIDKRTVDGENLRVIRGKAAVKTGIEQAVFGIFIALITLFMR